MTRVQLAGLSKRFGAIRAVEALDLAIDSGELVALLGPSGCGKTTTLLLLAGLYRPTAGSILFDGRPVERLPPKDRGIGMVFQSYALYPHLSIEDNIAFPLDVQGGVAKPDRARRVREAAELVRVAELLRRRPAELSGGQQQRVALARALVKQPRLLLLDEPLSNLDARLRQELRGEIKHLQKELGITSLFVTHDQAEATTMADRVALLRDGRLEAYATPDELYRRPATLFAAEFVGSPPINVLPLDLARRGGTLVAVGRNLTLPLAGGVELSLPDDGANRPVKVAIRAEDLTLTEPNRGYATGEVYLVEPLGRERVVEVRFGEHAVRVIAPPSFAGGIGDRVGLDFDLERLHLFEPEGGKRLN